jgi:hypothetical protein
MTDKLNVTIKLSTDWKWTGYAVRDGRAVSLCYGNLDECRVYAERHGFDGILIGAPSVDWIE